MSALSAGSTIAGCRLEAVAGRGGMGVVWRATQLALGRPVAVKVIAPHYAEDPGFRERFQHEAHLAASIDHPNVIPVYEAGEGDGLLFLIMRWVQGTELRALLRREGRLEPAHAVRLLRPVSSALHAAHRRGLVHRDVKPANVLVAVGDGEEEHVYLTDFGIARRLDTDAAMTRTGALVGTLDYVAPERIEGGRGDAASDIYSLGCMAYETLTGAVPFDRPTELAKMHAHVHDPPPSVRDGEGDVPPALDAIVRRAMAKDPAERFGSAAEMAVALTGALEELEADPRRRERADADTDETDLPAPSAPADATRSHATAPLSAAPDRTRPLPLDPPAPPAGPPSGGRSGPGGRSRRRALLAGGGVLAVAAVVALVVALSGGGSGGGGNSEASGTSGTSGSNASSATKTPAAPKGSGAAQVDQSATLTVPGGRPSGVARAAGRTWVAVPATQQLIGLAKGKPPVTANSGARPHGIAADTSGRVWIARGGGVTVFDPATRKSSPVSTGSDPAAVVFTPTAAWVADPGQGAVTRISLDTLQTKRVDLGAQPTGVLSAYNRLWVGTEDGRMRVLQDDGSADQVGGPTLRGRVVAGAPSRGVWVLSATGGGSTLTRIDPRREVADQTGGGPVYHEPPGPPKVTGAPVGLVSLDDAFWAATGDHVTRFGTNGPGTKRGEVTFPGDVGAVALGDGAVWATDPDARRVYRIPMGG